jgi:hypothetical protein
MPFTTLSILRHTRFYPATMENIRITNFHENIFKSVIAISTLGASITFQAIIQQIDQTNNVSVHHLFRRTTARNFLAIAWICFVGALGTSSLAAILLAVNKDIVAHKIAEAHQIAEVRQIAEARHRLKKYELSLAIVSGILLLLMLSAFFFSSLAVTSYCSGVGWAGCVLSGVFFLLSLALWLRYMLYRKSRYSNIYYRVI